VACTSSVLWRPAGKKVHPSSMRGPQGWLRARSHGRGLTIVEGQQRDSAHGPASAVPMARWCAVADGELRRVLQMEEEVG
jgi:hypothetical protein